MARSAGPSNSDSYAAGSKIAGRHSPVRNGLCTRAFANNNGGRMRKALLNTGKRAAASPSRTGTLLCRRRRMSISRSTPPAPVDQRPRAVVVPASELELEIGHQDVPSTSGKSVDLPLPVQGFGVNGDDRTRPERHLRSSSRPDGSVASTGAFGTPAASSRSAIQWLQTWNR